MNTLDGMIADLERDDTHIGGCTTAGEVAIMLKQLRDDTIVIPSGATNGDVMKAIFDIVKSIDHLWGEVSCTFSGDSNTHFFDSSWWNAPYKRAGDAE